MQIEQARLKDHELERARTHHSLERIMQVNKPVVDENLMVLVPTQIKPGKIRATDRLFKHGLLGLADDKKIEDIIEEDGVRAMLLRNAIRDTYSSRISNKLATDELLTYELEMELQRVAYYA